MEFKAQGIVNRMKALSFVHETQIRFSIAKCRKVIHGRRGVITRDNFRRKILKIEVKKQLSMGR